MLEEPLLFALGTSQPFGAQVAAELGLALAAHEERRFEDRESKLRPLRGVRGRDVYVLHALHDEPWVSVHDKLCELLEAMGVDCVMALEVHNRQAFENAFRCRTEHLEARVALAEAVLERLGEQACTVVSPDSGGLERAELFRQAWRSAPAASQAWRWWKSTAAKAG